VANSKHLLSKDEPLLLDLRPHWLFLFPSAAALVVSIIIGLLVEFQWDSSSSLHSIVAVLAGALVLASLIWFGWKYATWATTSLVLTSERVITRKGVLSKSGVDIPLEEINTVFFHQSLLERIVGAGDLGIESAGERGTETFTHVRKPSAADEEIRTAMGAKKARAYPQQGAAPHADQTMQHAPGIPEQIDKLAELHARGVLSDAEFAQKKAELLDRM
jgi:uncharacterized membrane protein YdbT with pleckstrin-like domain